MRNRGWQIQSYVLRDERHGTFFVTVHPDGAANAARVYGAANIVETIRGPASLECFDNLAAALIACEARRLELDRAEALRIAAAEAPSAEVAA